MSKLKVLVIDDHADTRLLLHAQLKAHQYDTAFAADGMEAMAMARRVRPDVILLDLGLPAGTGWVVLDRLKSNTALACIPVIIVSAEEPQRAEARALKKGAAAYLHKPIDSGRLIAAIQTAIAPPAAERRAV
jgi:two-component system phosphate regulon response regulator PhoB